ncbi:MAG TPA: hypothetical protein VMK31_09470 [Sphingomicrobium sp.]|nr:hypothetical protein [Sphingomicrobium sp.]
MRDVSYVVALFGVLFLIAAAFAWWRIYQKPAEKPPTAKDSKRADSAAMFIIVAFLLTALAAILAVLRWF